MRHLFLSAFLFAPCMHLACGGPPPMTSEGRHKAHADTGVGTWDIGPSLAERKSVVVDACRQAGRSDETIALVLAVIMGETEHCLCCERDASKDGMGMAKNYSAFNANLDFLTCLGISGAAAEALNDDANLGDATRAILAGIDKYGEDRCLSFHRGGSTARDDMVSYGAVEYRASMREIQQFILADKTLFTDGRRVGKFIVHV